MTRRKRSKKYKAIGNKYPAYVMSNNSCIMLSKLKVPYFERKSQEQKYLEARRFNSFGIIIYKFYEKYLESKGTPIPNDLYDYVMERSIWKYLDELEEITYESYINVLSNLSLVVNSDSFSEDFVNMFNDFMKPRIITKKLQLCTRIEIKCYAENAVDEIKKLFVGLSDIEENVKIKLYCQTPPFYEIFIEGDDEEVIIKLLNEKSNAIKERVNKTHTHFNIQTENEVLKKGTISTTRLTIHDVNKWFKQISE